MPTPSILDKELTTNPDNYPEGTNRMDELEVTTSGDNNTEEIVSRGEDSRQDTISSHLFMYLF